MAHTTATDDKQKHGRQEMLLFQLGSHQNFGINVLKIKEIIPYERLNQLPGSHHAIVGIVRLRGAPVTVIDLSSAIGMRPIASDSELDQYSIIISEVSRTLQGFLIRTIDRIISLNWDQITPPPQATGRYNYITGIAKIDEQLVEIIDIERVINEIAPPKQIDANQINLSQEHQALLQQKLVMIVDDSSMARKQVANTLDGIGLNYVMAQNGTEALQRLHELEGEGQHVDLIISDIEMPEMDGYTLTREIRKNEDLASIYVLLHTSLAQSVSEANAQASGANAALTKFVTEELAKAVVDGLSNQN